MTEEHRQRIIRLKLSRLETHPLRPAISTGIAALDESMGGGGLPRGQIVEWYGPPSSGKTTLALRAVARLQETGSQAAWIDADRTFDSLYAAAFAVRLERLPLAQPQFAEEALAMAARLIESGAVDLVVVDSAAALIPRVELGAEIGANSAGLHNRVLASGLRRLRFLLRRYSAVALFLNQSRSHPDAGFAEAETSAGGPALKLHAAVRVAFQPEGRRLRLRTLKNAAGGAFATSVVEWGGAPERPV